METQNKTPWKKNLDSNFISGEDLISGIKGLSAEMIVILDKFNDSETFDQKKQNKQIVTGLFFKTLDNNPVYKPAILNKTNAKFLEKECGSPFMENWIGKTVIMFAQKDSRHGHVVRFKTYHLPLLVLGSDNFNNCKKAYDKDPKNLAIIKRKYNVTAEVESALKQKI